MEPSGSQRGRGRAPRREALFHFPALLRFLRSVSLTSLNFTALGLWPPAPPWGGSGCWVWDPTPAEGWPHQAGRGSGPGRPDSAGRPACEPLYGSSLGPSRKVVWAVLGQGAGFASERLRSGPAPYPDSKAGHASLLSQRVLGGVWWWGPLEEGIRGAEIDASLGSPLRCQIHPTPSFPWGRMVPPKSRGGVKYSGQANSGR